MAKRQRRRLSCTVSKEKDSLHELDPIASRRFTVSSITIAVGIFKNKNVRPRQPNTESQNILPSFGFVDSTYEWYRAYKHVIAVGALAMICTLYYSWSSTALAPNADTDIRTITCITGNCWDELTSIEPWITNIVVEGDGRSLSDFCEGEGVGLNTKLSVKNLQIQTLEIRSGISFMALRQHFESMPNLKRVSIDLAESRGISCEIPNASSPSEFGEHLESLTLTNADEDCETLPLILKFCTNQGRQRLRELIIHNSTLNAAGCRALEGFMRGASGSLQEINIRESYLRDCDFRDIRLPALRSMVVLEPGVGLDFDLYNNETDA